MVGVVMVYYLIIALPCLCGSALLSAATCACQVLVGAKIGALMLGRIRDAKTVGRLNLFASRSPISEMYVTPFIDVLLVLLIMLIMAVTVATPKTEVDLPSGPCTNCSANLLENLVSIDAQDRHGQLVTRDEFSVNIEHASALAEKNPCSNLSPMHWQATIARPRRLH